VFNLASPTLSTLIYTMEDKQKLINRIIELTGWAHIDKVDIVTDTSDCMRIKRGDIVRVDGHDFVIKGNKYETRFGIEYQPKYWVFSAIDMETGDDKIIKTVFHEDFHVHIGVFKMHCYRSPEKEAEVLNLVQGDKRFMQGYPVLDDKENNVRIIEYIRGATIFNYVYKLEKSHEEYFHADLPGILHNLLGCFEAINFLHENKTCHGDIRNDHIIIEEGTRQYRWIDFDLNQHVSDFDLWSIGNIINYAVGKGINSFPNILKDKKISAEIKDSLSRDDASVFYEYRLMNLEKLYPYIPPMLSNIMNHFTAKPISVYSSMPELIDEYKEMLDKEFS